MEAKQFTHHPMFIGNNLKGDDNLSKMLRETFSNLFPSMAVDKVSSFDVHNNLR